MEMFFWCESGEDGTSITGLTRAELTDRLDLAVEDGRQIEFLTQIPENDKGCWRGVAYDAIVIIKGEIVVPEKIKVVTRYRV